MWLLVFFCHFDILKYMFNAGFVGVFMKNIMMFLLLIIQGITLYGSSRDSNSSIQSIRTQPAIISVEPRPTLAQEIAYEIATLSDQLPVEQQGTLGSTMSLESLLAGDLRSICQQKIIQLLFLKSEQCYNVHPDNARIRSIFNEQKAAFREIIQCDQALRQAINVEGLEERKARAYLKVFNGSFRLLMPDIRRSWERRQ